MEYIGEHSGRKVYWWEFSNARVAELPEKNWVCFAIAEKLPENKIFDEFARVSIAKGILEFKTFGKESTKLDDWFDETIVIMETMENHPEIDVMTTWHDKESLANAFWQCFHATCLPEETVNENVKIVCFHFNNSDKKQELKEYIKRYNEGWLPSEEV